MVDAGVSKKDSKWYLMNTDEEAERMKILRPGKVEQRKFACKQCGCVFVADSTDVRYSVGTDYVVCPCCETSRNLTWKYGEPYEEPTEKKSDRDRLWGLIQEWEWDSSSLSGFDQFLLDHGVTFREGLEK